MTYFICLHYANDRRYKDSFMLIVHCLNELENCEDFHKKSEMPDGKESKYLRDEIYPGLKKL